MAKRFTDTQKYQKPFFRGLRGPYKLLWDYLYHSCDNAGIWIVDFEIAQLYVGKDMPIGREDAIKIFKEKVVVFDGGKKWFIPSFIEFQYDVLMDQLNPNNNAHLSVIKKLKKEGLWSPSQGALDKDKDKDIDKDQVKDKDQNPDFEEYEQWTKAILSGDDWLFNDKVRNMNVPVGDRISEFGTSHLALLAKYPKMRPTDQNRFRISLIGHIQEKLSERQPMTSKPKKQSFQEFNSQP
jgi:hypothetical protein